MAEPPQPPQWPRVDAFKGLNNRLDPVRLGLEWQLEAANMLCDDGGSLLRRPGNKPVATGFKDMYGTRNGRLLLITTADALVERLDDGTTISIATGITGAPFVWCELGYALFVQSVATSAMWAIYPDRVIEWGSLCPSVSGTSYPLTEQPVYPPPKGQVLAARRSQIAVGVWESDQDRSVIYFSRPDYPHEFTLMDFIMVPGRITLLAALAQGLVIGTDRGIYFDSVDSPIQRLSDYGVPLNALATDDRNFVTFWTERGLCKAMPFENLTDKALAVQLRQNVTAGILPYQGSAYTVVSMTGPLIPKQISRPYTPVSISTTKTQGITL